MPEVKAVNASGMADYANLNPSVSGQRWHGLKSKPRGKLTAMRKHSRRWKHGKGFTTRKDLW